MENPLISIITITYNAAAELPPTMHSVAEQTFTGFEHIVVDGASTDDTLLIARSEATPSLRILSERDHGLYDAMNKGLHMARGQYVLFLNAGDAFHTADTLKKYADAAAKGYDIIYADTVIVDAQRKILRPRHLSAPPLLTRDSFSKGMLICHQAFMVRRALAPDYDLQYRFSADYDWTVKCITATAPEKCLNLNCIAIDYLDEGTTEKNKIASLRERFHVMRHHYGAPTAIARHLSFIPRALLRKLSSRPE